MDGMTSGLAEIDAEIKLCLECAKQVYAQHSSPSSSDIEHRFERLSEVISRQDALCRTYGRSDEPLCELLSYCPILLTASHVGLAAKHNVARLLYNICRLNVQLRSLLAGDLAVCSPLYIFLKHSLQHEAGPQVLCDVLRLLVLLTYDANVQLQSTWVEGLTIFLLKEVCRTVEVEWTSACLAILNNLYTKSMAVRLSVRKSDLYGSVCKRLVKLLEHRSTVMVVCALSLIYYTDEHLRDSVYSVKYLSQTYQCVFNILVRGDDLLARHYTVDLISRLVAGDPLCSGQVKDNMTTQIQLSALVKFAHLPRCLQQATSLLSTLDPSSEALSKVYDLLLLMSGMSKLETQVHTALREAQPVGTHLATPVLAMCQAACSASPQIIHLRTPLKAFALITRLLRDTLEQPQNGRVVDFVPEESLMQLLECSVKCTLNPASAGCGFDCERMLGGVTLAAVLCADEELRNDVLDTLDAGTCAAVADTQLAVNPIVLGAGRLPDWSAVGASVVVGTLQLLACLKDHSKPHKDVYWRLLKDARLLHVLGFCLRAADPQLIDAALHALVHCAQIHSFDYARLSALMASHSAGPAADVMTDSGVDVRSQQSPEHNNNNNNGSSSQPDVLMQSYERQLADLQLREKELVNNVTNADHELSKVRASYVTLKRRCDTSELELQSANRLVAQQQQQLEGQRHVHETKLSALADELSVARAEVEDERQLHVTLRGHYDKMKAAFEETSGRLLQAEEDNKQAKHRLRDTKQLLADTETKLTESKQQCDAFESQLKNKSNQLAEKDARIEQLNTDVDDLRKALEEQKKITEMIHKITGGKIG